jgi:Nif-specific regulatory protein
LHINSEPVHVWVCSPDQGFAGALISALGPGFEAKVSEEMSLPGDSKLSEWWHVVLLDLRQAVQDTESHAGFRMLEQFCHAELTPPTVAIVPAGEHRLTLKAMSVGAYHVVESPPNMIELRLAIQRANRFRQTEWDLARMRVSDSSRSQLFDLVDPCEELRGVFALARKVAPSDASVLITGETGTGKELLGRAIHRLSRRAQGPFIAFSCANLPENLVEDELFGHERGAFTGAVGLRRGRFEMADGGVLFLDEIGDLPLGLQPKLLRVLQDPSFERLGGSTKIRTDLRTIFATNRDLKEMVAQGSFREDLYYRLNVFPIHIPPLRKRPRSICVLAQHFLQRYATQFGSSAKRFSSLALQALEEYHWPGNVRELENVIQRAVLLAEGRTIEPWHLPQSLHRGFAALNASSTSSYHDEVQNFKRRLILRTLEQCNGNRTEAARRLKVARGYFHRLLSQLAVDFAKSRDHQRLADDEQPSRLTIM